MQDIKWFHHSPSGSQHTAGGFVTDSADRRSSDAQTICHVHHSQEYGRLIAVAPEMLEALTGLMAVVGDSKGVAGYHLNGDIAEWDEFEEVKTARMLISKIRGER